jgi:hypothetical protein
MRKKELYSVGRKYGRSITSKCKNPLMKGKLNFNFK